jgi:hypothetical protein
MQQTVMHHRPLVLKVIVSVSSSSSSSCLSVSLRSFEDYAKFLSSFKGGSPSETAISPTTVFLLHFKDCRSGNDSTCNGGRRANVVEEPGRPAMYTHRDETPPSTLTPLFCSPHNNVEQTQPKQTQIPGYRTAAADRWSPKNATETTTGIG